MSRPPSPRTGDIDAVLRDDLALEQISHGRRPRGADKTLQLLCALAEDVEVRVPRRRLRGSRFTRGVIATTVAATVLGVTGVAAAQPGDQGGFALWAPQPNDSQISAADRSLAEARMSLTQGRTIEADAALDRADAQLRKAGRSKRADKLRNASLRLRSQSDLRSTGRTSQTTPQTSCLWRSPPGDARTAVVCGRGTPTRSWPEQTPDPSDSSPSSLPSLLHLPTVTVQPTTPGEPSPSSPSSPSARPSSPKPTASGGDHSTPSKPRPRPGNTP
ncbi:MAG: hypothetical protein J2P24_13530 [Streptosporangiales bacterium]|nr:hypothetical protein [Streptosporangiales bacterium]MBO0892632.1 hypothetical protein [Acidothermales bacterium]